MNYTQSDGFRDNSKYERKGGMILGKFQLGESAQASFFTNLVDVKAFIPSSLNREDYIETPERAAPNWQSVEGFEDYQKIMVGASHQFRLASIDQFEIQNKTTLFTSFRNAYESRPFNILDEETLMTGFRSTFNLVATDQQQLDFPLLALGIEWVNEDYAWQTFETNGGVPGRLLTNNEENRRYYNLFAQSNWAVNNQLTLLTGLNLNNTSYDYTDLFTQDSIDFSGNYTFNTTLSPRLGLSYSFSQSVSVFTSVSHGFSPPTVMETLNPDGTINPDIQPETVWNIELGARGQLFESVLFEVSFYQMMVRDLLITRRAAEDQFIGINAGQTRHRGIEIFLEYDWLKGTPQLKTYLSYSFNDYEFVDFQDADGDYSGNQLTGTPPHHLNVGIDYTNKFGFYGTLNFQWVDAFPIRDDNSLFTDSYHLMNIKLGYEKNISKKLRLNLFAGIQNLFNEKYASMILINASSFGGNAPRYYYPGNPRNYYGGINLTWRS